MVGTYRNHYIKEVYSGTAFLSPMYFNTFYIVVFGYTSYIAVQNASVTAARKLSALTGQISAVFSQGGIAMVHSVKEIASNKAMLSFLSSNGIDSADAVQQLVNNASMNTLLPRNVSFYLPCVFASTLRFSCVTFLVKSISCNSI